MNMVNKFIAIIIGLVTTIVIGCFHSDNKYELNSLTSTTSISETDSVIYEVSEQDIKKVKDILPYSRSRIRDTLFKLNLKPYRNTVKKLCENFGFFEPKIKEWNSNYFEFKVLNDTIKFRLKYFPSLENKKNNSIDIILIEYYRNNKLVYKSEPYDLFINYHNKLFFNCRVYTGGHNSSTLDDEYVFTLYTKELEPYFNFGSLQGIINYCSVIKNAFGIDSKISQDEDVEYRQLNLVDLNLDSLLSTFVDTFKVVENNYTPLFTDKPKLDVILNMHYMKN